VKPRNFYLQIPGTAAIMIGGILMRIRLLVKGQKERCVQIGIHMADRPLLQRGC
jgi:hypothetical protein